MTPTPHRRYKCVISKGHTTMHFTTDNTEGFTTAELAALNAEFDRRVAAAGIDTSADDMATLSYLDHIAEQVLAA